MSKTGCWSNRLLIAEGQTLPLEPGSQVRVVGDEDRCPRHWPESDDCTRLCAWCGCECRYHFANGPCNSVDGTCECPRFIDLKAEA